MIQARQNYKPSLHEPKGSLARAKLEELRSRAENGEGTLLNHFGAGFSRQKQFRQLRRLSSFEKL